MLQMGVEKSQGKKPTAGMSVSVSDAASTVTNALSKLDAPDVRMRRSAVGAVAEGVLVLEAVLLRRRSAWWHQQEAAAAAARASAAAVVECKTFRFRFVQHPELHGIRIPNEFFHVPATLAAPPEDEFPAEWESLDTLLDYFTRLTWVLRERAETLESEEALASKQLRQSVSQLEAQRTLLDSLRARVFSSGDASSSFSSSSSADVADEIRALESAVWRGSEDLAGKFSFFP
jgi:hypothetical protein